MSLEKQSAFTRKFAMADVDGDGVLKGDEVATILKALNLNPKEEEEKKSEVSL